MPRPTDLEMAQFQQNLYDLVSKHIRGDTPSSLFMCCGVMLKTCIEMYCSVLDVNKIEEILEEAIKTIPMLHDKVESNFDDITFH